MMLTSFRSSITGGWGLAMRTSPWFAGTVIAALLLSSWAVGYALGGAGVAAPHWFYIPIALAASRFGYLGAALASVLAGALAGPLLPLEVATGLQQSPPDWLTRTAFFVAIGQFVAWLIARNQHAERDLGTTRRTVSVLEGLLERQEGERVARRWAVERIREVLAAGGPDIVFQPIVDLRDGRVVGVEALARFQVEPKRGPDFWFEEAWKAGLGLDLELAALLAALRSADPLLAGGLPVSVNLSPEVVASREFLELLPTLQTNLLLVEITEHAQVDDYDALAEPVGKLQELGGKLAVDDVGAGFASLQHILRLAPDEIKLDVGLTRGIDVDRARRALALGLVSFAAELGCSVVAEGIESREELDALRSLGVSLGQGYFLGAPAVLEEIDLARPQRILQAAGLKATG
jgi:EAL domain-containing protein (putative c-di-GMP-specific phosphodiesterase class I)